jgi:predicted MPP superfamily phosphohydrolase
MRKQLTFILLASLLSISGFAQEQFAILYGPYLQGVTENEVTVVWVTNRKAVSWVELAPNDENDFYAEARPPFFETNFGRKVTGTLHKVRIFGLEKGTKYRYRIYSKEVTAEEPSFTGYGKVVASDVYQKAPLTFKTLDVSKQSLHFAVVNDIHADSKRFASLLNQTDLKSLDFVLFNGDMVSAMESEKQIFDGFLTQAVQSFASELPFFFARGNHETRGLFSTEYIRYFPTPTGQPFYTFRQGPAFFIILDAGEDKPDSDIEYHGLSAFDQYREAETDWLKKVLDSEEFKQAPVKIAIMHVPPTSSTWHGSLEVNRLFLPLLNRAGIHLMLSGHLHQHIYTPKGEGNCNFPILINSNLHIADIQIQNNAITIRIKDVEGKLFKEIML